jgi:hypothetical protein
MTPALATVSFRFGPFTDQTGKGGSMPGSARQTGTLPPVSPGLR